MINCQQKIVEKLCTILPTYYELFCNENTAKPCITYTLTDNYDDAAGNKTVFSRLKYTIKLWEDSLSASIDKLAQIDDYMRELGFLRVSANDLIYENHICHIMVYQALGLEKFN